MKTTKKNNPVQIGALLGILAATLYFIVKQMGGGNAPVTLTPVADTRAEEVPKTTAGIAVQTMQRDPFDHPALHRSTKDGTPDQNQTSEAQGAQTEAHRASSGSKVSDASLKSPMFPILPDHTKKLVALPVRPVFGATSPANPKSSGSGADISLQKDEDPLKGWRLTAIIGGLHPRAVIEGVEVGLCQVGVGEQVQTLEVAAIHEREIVLSDAHHLYTLSLTSAPSVPGDSKDNKDASVDTITTTARENDNGTAKLHP